MSDLIPLPAGWTVGVDLGTDQEEVAWPALAVEGGDVLVVQTDGHPHWVAGITGVRSWWLVEPAPTTTVPVTGWTLRFDKEPNEPSEPVIAFAYTHLGEEDDIVYVLTPYGRYRFYTLGDVEPCRSLTLHPPSGGASWTSRPAE